MTVYLYSLVECRPGNRFFGQPFYVGIGGKHRPRAHISVARAKRHGNGSVQSVILRHLRDGIEPEVRLLAIAQDREYAAACEKRAIVAYGRRWKPGERGSLCNIASGGDGPDPALMNEPSIVAKLCAAGKRRYAVASARAIQSAAVSKAYQSSCTRDRVSAATKAALKRPEVRERHLAALDRINAARTMEERSVSARRSFDRPERRANALRALAEINARPEVKDAQCEATRKASLARWANPETRARMIAAMKGVKKRKRMINKEE